MFGISFTAADLRRVIWTAIFAFIASFAAAATGWSTLPNFSDAKAAVIAAGIAALAAAFSAVKNLVLADGSRLK